MQAVPRQPPLLIKLENIWVEDPTLRSAALMLVLLLLPWNASVGGIIRGDVRTTPARPACVA